MNCGHVTFCGQPRAFLAVKLLNVVVAVVECGSKVSSGTARLAAGHRAVIDQHDSPASAREEIGRGHSGNPSSHDADIRAQILGKRLELRHFGCVHPDGGRTT